MTPIVLPKDYKPTDKEEFMNPFMKEFFKQKLLDWKQQLIRETAETIHSMQSDGGVLEPDITDRATIETDRFHLLRTREREGKLLSKIESALKRLEDGSYGYCEVTGEPINVNRLVARPIATMTIEAQEWHEKNERTHRDE